MSEMNNVLPNINILRGTQSILRGTQSVMNRIFYK